MNTISI